MLEQALLRSMSLSNADPTIFFTRPIALVIMTAALLSLAYSLRKFYWRAPHPAVVTAGHAPDPEVEASYGESGTTATLSPGLARVVPILTIAISIVLILVALEAPRPNIPMAIGPHVWPICILSLLIIFAVALLWQPNRQKPKSLPSAESTLGVGHTASQRYGKPELAVALTILGLVVYALLLETVGFLVCTMLLVLYQTRVIQKGHWVRNVATAVIFSPLLYFGMTKLLAVKLPEGLLGW
jgi:putative tricarboxylic transport membrane protein